LNLGVKCRSAKIFADTSVILTTIFYATTNSQFSILNSQRERGEKVFVILQIEKGKNDLRSRLRERFSPGEPGLSKIAVRNGAPFFVLTVREGVRGVPWDAVESAAGRGASRMLFTSELRPPENSGLRAVLPERLPFRAMFNSAESVLKGVAPRDVRLGILDREGELCGELARAAKLSSAGRIATRKTRLYEAAAEKIMGLYGASALVDGDEDFLENCNVVICRDLREALPAGAVVFAASGDGCGHANVVTGSGIGLPAEYAPLRPENADETLFACALFEYCGVRALEKQRFKRLFWDGKENPTAKSATKLLIYCKIER